MKFLFVVCTFLLCTLETFAQVGIGTTTPTNTLEINNGTPGNSGLRFTNLNSSSTKSTDVTAQALAVDALGDVVINPLNNYVSKTGSYNSSTPTNSTIIVGELECRYNSTTVGAPATGPQINLEFRSSSSSTLSITSCGYERYPGGIGSSNCIDATLNNNTGAFTSLAAGGFYTREILIYTIVTATGSIYEISIMDRAGTQWYIWGKQIK